MSFLVPCLGSRGFRPPRPTVSGHTPDNGLPRRDSDRTSPIPLLAFCRNIPQRLDLRRRAAAGGPPLHSALNDDARGVVVDMVVMPAGLADERKLRDPPVRADVPTEDAFPQALIRIEADARLSGRDSLITGESDNLTRGGSEDFLTYPCDSSRSLPALAGLKCHSSLCEPPYPLRWHAVSGPVPTPLTLETDDGCHHPTSALGGTLHRP